MHIPSHQIHNVLKAYQKLILRKKGAGKWESGRDSEEFSGKQHAMVEKITKDIAARIIESGIARTTNPDDSYMNDPPRENIFVFNLVTEEGKVTRTLALETDDLFIDGLEKTESNPDVTSEKPGEV